MGFQDRYCPNLIMISEPEYFDVNNSKLAEYQRQHHVFSNISSTWRFTCFCTYSRPPDSRASASWTSSRAWVLSTAWGSVSVASTKFQVCAKTWFGTIIPCTNSSNIVVQGSCNDLWGTIQGWREAPERSGKGITVLFALVCMYVCM